MKYRTYVLLSDLPSSLSQQISECTLIRTFIHIVDGLYRYEFTLMDH